LTVALAKISLAAAAMGFTAVAIERASYGFVPGAGFIFQTLRLGLSITGALIVLIAAGRALKIPELDELLATARVRVRKLLNM
jgi:hypothetical protein